MKQKKLTGIFMALIMLFSVMTTTAVNSIAAEGTLQSNTPITIRVIDGASGTVLSPDFITIKATNDNSFTDTFQRNGQISFVPSYCTANNLVSNYDISVKAAGYKEFHLSEAFTYYRAITFVPMNDHMSIDGNTLTIRLDQIIEPDINPITLRFEDMETGAPVVPDTVTVTAANDNTFSNTFEEYNPITFVPYYFKTNHLVSNYDLSVKTAGYKNFDLSDAFTYYTALTFVPMNDHMTVDGNTLTIKLDKKAMPVENPITIQFQDYETGAAIVPDSVTVKAGNDSTFADTFQQNGHISFIPSYFKACTLVSNYNIAVKTAGYKDFNITDAFTYYGSLTFVPMDDQMTVDGNTLTIKLKRNIIPEIKPIAIQFQDYETGAAIVPDSVTVKAGKDGSFADTFQKNGQIYFIPSYFASNLQLSAYDLEVTAAGYKNFSAADAFTYYGSIIFAPLHDQINVTGNSLTIRLKK